MTDVTDVTDTPPILDIQGLSIDLPGGGERSAAVRDVSLRVGRGEIVCLVGESGSGKSVIAQSVMGLLPKTLPVRAGCIRLQGEDSPLARAVGGDWKGKLSPVIYAAGIVASFGAAWFSQLLYALAALLWLVPDRRIERALARHES